MCLSSVYVCEYVGRWEILKKMYIQCNLFVCFITPELGIPRIQCTCITDVRGLVL